MLTVKNKVNTYLLKRLTKDDDAPYKDKKLYFSSTMQSSPKELPMLNVTSLGEPQTKDDLDGTTQNFITSTIQIKAYSDTSVTDAFTLIGKACDVMLEMRYKLIYGPEDISDTDKIVVARFSRIVGSGDKLY